MAHSFLSLAILEDRQRHAVVKFSVQHACQVQPFHLALDRMLT